MDPIVFDLGGDSVRAGAVSTPVHDIISVRSIIGIPRDGISTMLTSSNYGDQSLKFGEEIRKYANGPLDRLPIQDHNGVPNIEHIEKLLQWIITNKLQLQPEHHECLFAMTPWVMEEIGARLLTICFETFNLPGLALEMDSLISIFSHGLTSGIVLDSGHNLTRVVPIYEGYNIPAATHRQRFGGNDITGKLSDILACEYNYNQRYFERSAAGHEWLLNLKHSIAEVPSSLESIWGLIENLPKQTVELPDGTQLEIDGDVGYQLGDSLFDPAPIKEGADGLHAMVFSAIQSCDIDMRRDCYHSIVLSGGNSSIKGVHARFNRCLMELVPATMHVKSMLHDPGQITTSIWTGGSILAGLTSYNDKWIYQDEYDELGPSVLARRLTYAIR